MFFSFCTLNILACCFWTLNFLVRNLVITLLRLPYMWSVAFFFFFFFYFQYSLALVFGFQIFERHYNVLVWSSCFLEFIELFGCLMSFVKFGTFSNIIFSHNLPPFFLSLLLLEFTVCMLICLMVSYKVSETLFASIFFLSIPQTQ